MARALATPSEGVLPPVLNPMTRSTKALRELLPPQNKVAAAVYGFTDQTGQFKPADTVQQLSRAVTQGATSVLIKAMQDAGSGTWFTVVEREKLSNLLKERRIIADMRNIYLGERKVNPKALPPLLFAGVLLEGGIIGFDSNTRTGGAGARYLGVGGDAQYREDTVTVYLRTVSTRTGEVLLSIVAHKTIISIGIRGSVFKFVALDKILEAEAGLTSNEPKQLAVQQAIEKAVHATIVEGSARGIWSFADRNFQEKAIEKLDEEQSRVVSSLAHRATGARRPDGAGKPRHGSKKKSIAQTQRKGSAKQSRKSAVAKAKSKPATNKVSQPRRLTVKPVASVKWRTPLPGKATANGRRSRKRKLAAEDADKRIGSGGGGLRVARKSNTP
ncbi:MAG: CsgG/HfaB family protein [Boseongicola sp.]